jgi:hypothetical protein
MRTARSARRERSGASKPSRARRLGFLAARLERGQRGGRDVREVLVPTDGELNNKADCGGNQTPLACTRTKFAALKALLNNARRHPAAPRGDLY